MLMINTENSFFFDIFSLFLQVLPQKMHLAMKIFPFFSLWYLFNIVAIKDFKKLSSKC